MCSFLFSSLDNNSKDLDLANIKLKKRGPDTTLITSNIIYNILEITSNNNSNAIIENEIIVLFNGEIYNFEGPSEIDFIRNLYKMHGIHFASYLDGEFAIFIFDKKLKKVLLSVDTFKTKPLFYSFSDKIGVCSYRSPLHQLGFKDVQPMSPNTTLIYSLMTKTIKKCEVVKFNLNQFKNTYDDVIDKLINSVLKRCNTNKKIFMGISSGYDSNSIAAITSNLKKEILYMSYPNKEDISILRDNEKFIKINYLNMSKKEEVKSRCFLYENCEDDIYAEYRFLKDPSTPLLANMGLKAKAKGCKIFLSGTGSDEIMGDYFIKNNYENSTITCFKGRFTSNLKTIFPWKNFYSGSMRNFLVKDEYVMGSLGLETRYPFLDKQFVQEFLNLNEKLKNRTYKAPLEYFLSKNSFAFLKNQKIGFSI